MRVDEAIEATGVAQVMVYLKPAGPAAAAKATTLSEADRRIVPRQVAKARDSDASLPLAEGHASDLKAHFRTSEMSQDSALASAGAGSRKQVVPVKYYPNLGIMLGNVDKSGLAALRKEPAVEHVEPAPPISLIRPIKSMKAAAGAQPKLTYGIRQLKVDTLWGEGLTGVGVLVGHLDTGVEESHETLSDGAIKHFAKFDDMGFQVTPTPPIRDTDDHGTHTAATIAGRGVRGRHVGVAPGAELASAVVIEGGNVIARILGGMDWCVGLGIRILNMSLGLRDYSEHFLPLTQTLRQLGVLPVFAVGNEGPGTSRSPGNYPEALSVGAVDEQRRIWGDSSSQRFNRKIDPVVPDIVGPGVDVYSADPRGGYQTMSGTSMATPHISGLAALLWQAKPDATVAQIEHAIFASCESKGIPADRCGRGIPDGPKALAELRGTAPGRVPARGGASKPGKKPTKKASKKGKPKSSPKKQARRKASATTATKKVVKKKKKAAKRTPKKAR